MLRIELKRINLWALCFVVIMPLMSSFFLIIHESDAGDYVETMRSGFFLREYLLHVPKHYDRTKPTPLVLFFHGRNRTGLEAAKITGFSDLADQKNFIVVYPEGIDKSWNDGRGRSPAERKGVNDVRFVKALIEELTKKLNIDPKRIFASGRSNGAILTYSLACELSEKIAAIAPVAGTMPEKFALKCPEPIPFMLIHGTEDKMVPWNGGEAGGGRVLSAPETIKRWVTLNSCPTSPQITYEPDKDVNDGTKVRREAYGPCQKGSGVVLYAIEGGGHTWPGGTEVFYLGPESGRVSYDGLVKSPKPKKMSC